MYCTLSIGSRSINPARPGEIIYKITFARPVRRDGRGKTRRTITPKIVVYCHATDAGQAVRIGKREAFSGFSDAVRYGPEFDNTSMFSIRQLLNGRIISEVFASD